MRYGKYMLVWAGWLFLQTTVFALDVDVLTASEWAVPKKAETILSMPAIRKMMRALDADPDSRLKLKYPGGDEGTLWVNELRSWLVALGLSSARIDTVPGSAISGIIEMEVVK